MKPAENQVEAQIFDEEPNSNWSVRNLVIGVVILLLALGSVTYAYFEHYKTVDSTNSKLVPNTDQNTKSIEASVPVSKAPSNQEGNASVVTAPFVSASDSATTIADTPTDTITTTNADSIDTATSVLENELSSESDVTENQVSFCEAIFDNDLDLIRSLVDDGIDLKETDSFENTIIWTAIISENVEIIKFLMEKGVGFNITMQDNNTPSLEAIKSEKDKITKHLIDIKIDFDAVNNFDSSATDFIIEFENAEILRLMIEKGSTLQLNMSDFTFKCHPYALVMAERFDFPELENLKKITIISSSSNIWNL